MLRSHDGYTIYSSLTGVVSHGKKLGRTIGFPTLNLSGSISSPLLSGTYKVRVMIDGQFFTGMGVWFADKNYCEVHCLDMDGKHWYELTATVTFLEFIRVNKQFGSVEDLQSQLKTDKQRLTRHFTTGMTFGSFDLVHAGHEAYLTFAKQHCDSLITVVSSDTSVRQFKHREPMYSQTLRAQHITQLGLSDRVVVGDESDHFAVLRTYQPDILILGYDQNTLGVQQRYNDSGLTPPVFVQAPSYRPDQYKSSLLKNS